MTQKELAAIARLSVPTVNRFEQGDTSLTVKSMLKILRALGIVRHD